MVFLGENEKKISFTYWCEHEVHCSISHSKTKDCDLTTDKKLQMRVGLDIVKYVFDSTKVSITSNPSRKGYKYNFCSHSRAGVPLCILRVYSFPWEVLNFLSFQTDVLQHELPKYFERCFVSLILKSNGIESYWKGYIFDATKSLGLWCLILSKKFGKCGNGIENSALQWIFLLAQHPLYVMCCASCSVSGLNAIFSFFNSSTVRFAIFQICWGHLQ